MRLVGIDHVTIRVPPAQVEALRAFYEDLIGLRTGPRRLTFPGVWLYQGDQALIHVAGNMNDGAPPQAAPADWAGFDHVAFRMVGLASAKARLDQAGIPWRQVWRPEIDILQLVLADPAGTKVELTFDPAEHPDSSGPRFE